MKLTISLSSRIKPGQNRRMGIRQAWRSLLPLLLLSWTLTACQGSPLRDFEGIQLGMDKHQVLEKMDSPNASTRFHGRDRWIYSFYDHNIRFDKEVHFLRGVVVYSGDPVDPEVARSAAKEDANNAEIEAAYQKDVAARRQAQKDNAAMYRDYEARIRNRDKVKYMPDFQDVK